MTYLYHFAHGCFFVEMEADGRMFIQKQPVSSYSVCSGGFVLCQNYIEFETADGQKFTTPHLDSKIIKDFERWAWSGKVQFAKPALDPVMVTERAPTCPECYGSGYHKGFGGPCKRGCKP